MKVIEIENVFILPRISVLCRTRCDNFQSNQENESI